MRNIKGLSEMVSVVLLILMITLAVAIIYPQIKKISSTPQLSPDLCINKKIFINSICYNSFSNNTEIMLTKNDEKAIELVFQFEFTNKTSRWKCDSSCSNCEVQNLGTKTYFIHSEEVPEKVSVLYGNCKVESEEILVC